MSKFIITLKDGTIHEGTIIGFYRSNCGGCVVVKKCADCVDCKDMGNSMVDLCGGHTREIFERSVIKTIFQNEKDLTNRFL